VRACEKVEIGGCRSCDAEYSVARSAAAHGWHLARRDVGCLAQEGDVADSAAAESFAMTLPADRMYVICVLEERRCHQLSASQSAWQRRVDSL
jgi:hypothetical protein